MINFNEIEEVVIKNFNNGEGEIILEGKKIKIESKKLKN